MTIGAWVVFAFTALFIAIMGFAFALDGGFSVSGKILAALICVILIVGLLCGMLWYFNNTARGQRMLVDQKSNLNNGMERTVTVYTANGDIIAQYTGLIDIEANDGGYIKFDLDGKRYMYYNCFVETIAEIS